MIAPRQAGLITYRKKALISLRGGHAVPSELNSIEHVWKFIKEELGKITSQSKNGSHLRTRIRKIRRNKIDSEIYSRLVGSIARRMKTIIKAKGGRINIRNLNKLICPV